MGAHRKKKRPRSRTYGRSKAGPAANPAHRPSTYRPEFCLTVQPFYENGATDQEVADELGISPRTLYRWQAQHAEFRQVIRLGKEVADDRVERAFYSRCVGYEYDTVKIMQHNGEPVVVPYREHVPPDPGAAFNWLKNRRADRWKDSKAITGADGGPVELRSVIELVDSPQRDGS